MRAKWLSGVAVAVAVAVALGCGGAVLAGDDKPDPREELATAIPEMIRLLEAEEYETLITSFASPEDLKRITEQRSIDEIVKGFREGRAQTLLAILKAINGQKPELDEAGTTATFTHGVKQAPRETIAFKKIGKYWYIQN